MTKRNSLGSAAIVLLVVCAGLLMAGCVSMPGGYAASSEPINGRRYRVMGRATGTDSRIYFLGFLPVTGPNSAADAIEDCIEERSGDAMIKVSVDFYYQWWIIFTRYTTRVEGDVIRWENR